MKNLIKTSIACSLLSVVQSKNIKFSSYSVGVLQNHQSPRGHRPPTTDHQPLDRSSTDPPTTNHQPTNQCSTDPSTIDHRLTDRSSTDPLITDLLTLLQLTSNPLSHQLQSHHWANSIGLND